MLNTSKFWNLAMCNFEFFFFANLYIFPDKLIFISHNQYETYNYDIIKFPNNKNHL